MTDLANYVTTQTFLKLIHSRYCINNDSAVNFTDFCKNGVRSGWIGEGDPAGHESAFRESDCLDRKNAARIAHEFLKKMYGEADAEDICPAKELKDLYDCHTCVNHIAQIYVKGVMKAEESLFHTNAPLTKEEAELIIDRMFDQEKRNPPLRTSSVFGAKKFSLEEALVYIRKTPQVILIDVRSSAEFAEEHLKGAIHIPLSEILKNPYQVADNRFLPLLFYCENGYRSEIAANCVSEAGYPIVGCFGLINTNK